MTSSLAGLNILLTENEKVLTELAAALKEEQRCIVELDLEQLAQNGCRKEELTARLTRLREECCLLMKQAGSELGLSDIPSLSPLIAATTVTEQRKLRPSQQRLSSLAQAVERQYAMNRQMLENSLTMIKNSMALFGRLLGGSDTYGAQGQINSSRASGGIFRQEI